MKIARLLAPLVLSLAATQAGAAEISTHVLDLTRGVGGADVPVVLYKRAADGTWTSVGQSRTDANGRVRSFGAEVNFDTGIYRLQFDMSGYPDASALPFFPELTVTFNVEEEAGHYHVPIVVSPYGYSTYRGN